MEFKFNKKKKEFNLHAFKKEKFDNKISKYEFLTIFQIILHHLRYFKSI